MLAEHNKGFFESALGFPSPWKVDSVELDESSDSVHIYMKYDSGFYTTEDGEKLEVYDYRKSRMWQHLPVLQYKCFLHCRIPRVKTSSSKIESISVPWADSRDSYTYLFNDYVIDVLQATRNQSKTSELVKTSFFIVNTIMHNSVKLGLSRRKLEEPIEHLNIDEKSIGKGHQYASILIDSKRKRVLDVCKGRDKESVKELFVNTLGEKKCTQVKAVCMDMWEAFMGACKEVMPEADIVHDKFHIVGYLSDAVDTCRKKEVKYNELLLHSKYALLKNQENQTANQRVIFNDIMDSNLYTAQAWAMSNQFKETVLNCQQMVEATAYFDMWMDKAAQLKIPSITKLSKTLDKHKEGILNYVKHKITNALAERVNGMIQNIKSIGRGYRTFENLRSAILFFNGKLELHSLKF